MNNGPLFAATVGGLGLTGLILWVEIKLAAIRFQLFHRRDEAHARSRPFFRACERKRGLALHAWPGSTALQTALGSALAFSRAAGMRRMASSSRIA